MKTLKKNSPYKWFLMSIILIAVITSCQKTAQHLPAVATNPIAGSPDNLRRADKNDATVATDWYRLQFRIMLERNSAFNGIYFSYIGLGLYESVRPGIKGASSFYGKINSMPAMPQPENNMGYSWPVSANAALAAMVRTFFSGLTPANNASIDSLEAAYNEKLHPAENSESFERSQAYGRSIAKAMHDWFLTDNMNPGNAGYVLPAPFPGSWVPAPGNPPIPVNPFVQNATAYIPADATALSNPFPFTYSESPGTDYYNMEKQVYDQSIANTAEQKQIALHWVDQGNGIGYTPPGHDLFIVTQALEQSGSDLATVAEAYAKAGIAEREATIVTFRSKYANFTERPVTYIRKKFEATWLPLFQTPPHPEYPAAHAMLTGTIMQALARVIGNDNPVADYCYNFRGYPTQHYSTIFGVAEQAGISRNYGGIHYLVSIKEGLRMAKIMGDRIGDIIVR